ncbi:hypothetical protein [Nitrosospira multiformis]|uniref:Uncharacterized protein n=1 Tax=Nitrosospira multiformis TaxID=1231 RepID=A0A1I7IT21_9PROT|nr:hypothetical protein [Nitrosospira multiformis]SFU76057.1 hypothetical protein SAMN05216417_1266 [Nitrosospira multiformis]
MLKPCQRPIPDQGRVLLDNSLQLFNRNVSSTSKKYRLLQKNIETFQKEYRVLQINTGFMQEFSGLLQLFEQVPGALPHAPRSPRGRGAGRPAIKSSLPLVLAYVASGSVKAMPSRGARARLDPAFKAKNSCSRKVSFIKRVLKPFGAFKGKKR